MSGATQGTLVAIQLAISQAAVESGARYRGTIEAAVAAALAGARPGPRLIVLPETAGHLALYALAPPSARTGRTLAATLAGAAVRRPLDVLRGAVAARVLDPRHAVLAGLAPDGERYWRALCAALARTHAAYVVAGSHLRLDARGALTNASHLFGPDGALRATTEKVNLVVGVEDAAAGGLGLTRGDPGRIPIAPTELGRVATLIGYDAYARARTPAERFRPLGPDLAARGGCTIVATPASHRAGTTDAAAWQRDGLPATLASHAGATPVARYGVTAHLVGGLLDLEYAGASEIVTRDASGEVRCLARAGTAVDGGHVVATVDL